MLNFIGIPYFKNIHLLDQSSTIGCAFKEMKTNRAASLYHGGEFRYEQLKRSRLELQGKSAA